MYGLEIQKLLVQKDQLTLPQDKIKLTQQAILISDSHHDTEWSVDLRLQLITEEWDYLPSKINSYEALSWIIGAYEENPELIEERSFLWQYKWIVFSVISNPNLSAAQKEQIVQDFSKRMTKNQYSLRPVYDDYSRFYTFFGMKDKATQYRKLRDAQGNDDMSDCKACEINSNFSYHLAFDSIDKAKAQATEILEKKQTCARVPISTYANLVRKLTQENRLEEAQSFVDKGINELFKQQEYVPRNFEQVVAFAYYYSKVDNQHAWELIEKHFPSQQMNDYSSYGIYLDILATLKNTITDTLELKLPQWLSFYTSENVYPTKQLYQQFYSEAQAILSKFAKTEDNPAMLEHLDNHLANS